jgi:hypothetical protein
MLIRILVLKYPQLRAGSWRVTVRMPRSFRIKLVEGIISDLKFTKNRCRDLPGGEHLHDRYSGTGVFLQMDLVAGLTFDKAL